MPRIHIDDLPPLQDLTEEQLKELFGAGRPAVRLSIEALEDRQLLATGLFSGAEFDAVPWASTASSQAATYQTVQQTTSPAATAILAPAAPLNQPIQAISPPIECASTRHERSIESTNRGDFPGKSRPWPHRNCMRGRRIPRPAREGVFSPRTKARGRGTTARTSRRARRRSTRKFSSSRAETLGAYLHERPVFDGY